uniref:Transposase n=1 Tax=Acrobeloides nanus TaxID=290746 RepID=A0A914D6B9_9BILA
MYPKCKKSLTLIHDNYRTDGFRWKCCHTLKKYALSKPEPCDTFVELRRGTFFEKSNLSIFQIIAFFNLWVGLAPLKLISTQLDIGHQTCVDLASFCREVLLYVLPRFNEQEPIGGENKVVEIDECNFSHFDTPIWVFGIVERGSEKLIMKTVEDRQTPILSEIVEDFPGRVQLPSNSDYC